MFGRKKPITDINKYFKKVTERVGSMRASHSNAYGRDMVMTEVVRMMVEDPSQTIANAMIDVLQRVDQWVVEECRDMRGMPKMAALAMIGKDKILSEDVDPHSEANEAYAMRLFKKHTKAGHFDPYAERNFFGMPKSGKLKKEILARTQSQPLRITHQPLS